MALYRMLAVKGNDEVLEDTQIGNEFQLASLFKITFGPGPMDNLQKSLAWYCYE